MVLYHRKRNKTGTSKSFVSTTFKRMLYLLTGSMSYFIPTFLVLTNALTLSKESRKTAAILAITIKAQAKFTDRAIQINHFHSQRLE